MNNCAARAVLDFTFIFHAFQLKQFGVLGFWGAVESTLLNAQANDVLLKAGLPDAVSGTYQTVLANILATPLKVLAPLLWSRVAPGGALVLAGILERQAEELKQAYAPYCQLNVSDQEDGWILMTAAR